MVSASDRIPASDLNKLIEYNREFYRCYEFADRQFLRIPDFQNLGRRDLGILNCDCQRILYGVFSMDSKYEALTGFRHPLAERLRARLGILVGRLCDEIYQRCTQSSYN